MSSTERSPQQREGRARDGKARSGVLGGRETKKGHFKKERRLRKRKTKDVLWVWPQEVITTLTRGTSGNRSRKTECIKLRRER